MQKSPHRHEYVVQVGGAEVSVNENEYILAQMPRNTPIEWGGPEIPFDIPFDSAESELVLTRYKGRKHPYGVGVLLFTWFYDGVTAKVQMGHKEITLWPASWPAGAWVRALPPERWNELDTPGMNGDGI